METGRLFGNRQESQAVGSDEVKRGETNPNLGPKPLNQTAEKLSFTSSLEPFSP